MTRFKGPVVVLLAFAAMLSGGCLNWQRVLLDTAIYAGAEFLFDNNNVLDLFPDGSTAAAE